MDRLDLDTLRSVEELQQYRAEVVSRMTEMNNERAGLPFSDEER